jgi:hypothetical protein
MTCEAGSDCSLTCGPHTGGACVLCCADLATCDLACTDGSAGASCGDGRMLCDGAACDLFQEGTDLQLHDCFTRGQFGYGDGTD